MGKNINVLLDEINNSPNTYKAVIAVTDDGIGLLLKIELLDNESFYDLFDGVYLDDNVDNYDDIPKEYGVYNCDITIRNWKCYEGDYDMSIIINNFEKIL
jgi:hypothetical protein